MGIGLALVKSLVEMHGGTVEARSAGPQQGSEFIVRLPVAAAVRIEPPTALVDGSDSLSSPAIVADGWRVLVVDDNVNVAKMCTVFLQESGYSMRMAHSGRAALEAATEFRPHAILLDIGLPEMDGYKVAQRLRHDPALKDVGLIAVTGYGEESDRQRCLAAGFDHHLVKAVDPEHLLKVLAGLTAQDGPLGLPFACRAIQ